VINKTRTMGRPFWIENDHNLCQASENGISHSHLMSKNTRKICSITHMYSAYTEEVKSNLHSGKLFFIAKHIRKHFYCVSTVWVFFYPKIRSGSHFEVYFILKNLSVCTLMCFHKLHFGCNSQKWQIGRFIGDFLLLISRISTYLIF
jgi:hypothetical protein